MAFLLSLEGIQRRDSHPRAEVFTALGQPILVHGGGPSWDQVHSSGPWDDPSREWSTMPVSSRGPRRRRSWWCHTPLIDPQHLHPCESGGVIRGGLQAQLDMGPHGIPRGRELSSQSRNGGSLETQLTHRPADRPCPQQRPGSTHLLAALQECHRLAGAFAAYPAPFVPSDPCRAPGPKVRRSPPPSHARALERSPHNPGSQQSDRRTLCQAPDHTHVERQRSDGSPPN